jgi:cytochrome c556
MLDPTTDASYPEGELGSPQPAQAGPPLSTCRLGTNSPILPSDLEICIMIRKWLVFALSAGILISVGVRVGAWAGQEEKESPLEKIMEKVNKASADIKKGTRNLTYFNKSQKTVEKSAKELVKLAKQAKPIKDAFSRAKGEADPQAKWNQFMDALISSSEKLGEVAAKPDATFAETKKAAGVVNKACVDCHAVFRVDDTENTKF